MKHNYKIIALAAIFALHSQTSIGCSQCRCDTEEIKISAIKACSCQQPKPPKPKSEQSDKVTAEIAVGELVDKITILKIKSDNIKNPEKLKNIRTELATLLKTLQENVPASEKLTELSEKLLEINKQLWDIEDAIRDKERERCFDKEFIEIARSVYYTNDERCRVKRKINDLTGSRLVEEKSYAAY